KYHRLSELKFPSALVNFHPARARGRFVVPSSCCFELVLFSAAAEARRGRDGIAPGLGGSLARRCRLNDCADGGARQLCPPTMEIWPQRWWLVNAWQWHAVEFQEPWSRLLRPSGDGFPQSVGRLHASASRALTYTAPSCPAH